MKSRMIRPGRNQWFGRVVFLFGAVVSSACSSTELIAQSPDDSSTVRAEAAGVAAEADAESGDRPQSLPSNVEAVKLVIHNKSDRGIHVSADDIELSGSGHQVTQITPQSINPRPPVQAIGSNPAWPQAPNGTPIDMRMAAQYQDPALQNIYHDRDLSARKAEISGKAFTGGYIESGKSLQGFVYFPAPSSKAKNLDLVVPVHTGEGSGAVVTLELPFAVAH